MSDKSQPITAALVKDLRERTAAGMMECKKYLVKTGGDIEAAIEMMRKDGSLKAAKKAGRTTAEGIIVALSEGNVAVLVEVNCETDFVSIGEDFQQFANAVAQTALSNRCATVEALSTADMGGKTVEQKRADLVAKIGENINVRRIVLLEAQGTISSYTHSKNIGVLVDVSNGDDALGKDIAMHIAASAPLVVSSDQVPAELIEKEKEIYTAQAQESGKPAEIIEKMVVGRVKKYLDEVCLLGQPFVKNPDVNIEQLLKGTSATINSFHRLSVGEGIEKEESNFVEEVMAQARGE